MPPRQGLFGSIFSSMLAYYYGDIHTSEGSPLSGYTHRHYKHVRDEIFIGNRVCGMPPRLILPGHEKCQA